MRLANGMVTTKYTKLICQENSFLMLGYHQIQSFLKSLIETAVKQSPFAIQQFANPNVLLALDLIRHKGGQATVKQLAQEIGLSTRQLERLFRKYVRASPKTCCKLVHLQYVLQLLETENPSSLAHIAHTCGYTDQAHLANEFRRTMGTSIKHYLQQFP